jgi:hypothetical protein
MRSPTRFEADNTRWQISKFSNDVVAHQLPAHDRFAMSIDAMDVEDILGNIDAYGCDGGAPFAPPQRRLTIGGSCSSPCRAAERDRQSHPSRLAQCYQDDPDADAPIHKLLVLIGQCILAIALGYENINDHDQTASRSRFRRARGNVTVTRANYARPWRVNAQPSAGCGQGRRRSPSPFGV